VSDKSIKELLNLMTIIVDTREHEHANDHIIGYFDKHNIPYVRRKLDFGDYSFEIPHVSYENKIAIERKMSLTELSGNVAQHRDRFEAEFTRAKKAGAKLILMVENGGWDKIAEHNYRTALSEKSFLASLFSFQHRYGIDIQFVPKKYAGMYICGTFHYYLRNEIKEMEGVAI
jgi:ERCC4-type nuclease